MLERLFRYVFGVYKISVESAEIENVLTRIIKSRADVKNIVRLSDGCITFLCYRRSFKIIKSVFDEYDNITYKALEIGFPVFLKRYRKRMGVPIGLIVFMISLNLISSFIWNIKIIGCEPIYENSVLNKLKECGFYVGVKKGLYNVTNIENSFLINNRDYSWISINVKGTTAYVEVRENVCKAKRLDTSMPSNIYASRDGVIASVDAYMGYSVVKEGDTVTAGDLIVSGEYTDKYGVEYLLHSYASVMAYTTHSYTVSIPYEVKNLKPTGKIKKNYEIVSTRFSIPLYFSKKISYNNYTITESNDYLKLFDYLYLPVWIKKTTYYDVKNITYCKTREEALNDAYEKLSDFEYNLVGITVLDRIFDIKETDEGVSVTVFLKCYEDIGVERQIV